MRLKYWKTKLSTDHTFTNVTRFSAAIPPLYRLLYLGENHQVVIYEVGALFGPPSAPVPNPAGSWVLITLDVTLYHVADLSDPSQQKLISTNDMEFTGNWTNASEPTATQSLGVALFSLPELEAVIVPSSKPGEGRNLVIFPDKLGPRSSIVFRNEITGKNETLPSSADR